MAEYIWPKVFTKPNYDYAKEFHNAKERRAVALANGLTGWGICMGGGKPPKLFGKAMVIIGQVLGITATPDNLQEMSL